MSDPTQNSSEAVTKPSRDGRVLVRVVGEARLEHVAELLEPPLDAQQLADDAAEQHAAEDVERRRGRRVLAAPREREVDAERERDQPEAREHALLDALGQPRAHRRADRRARQDRADVDEGADHRSRGECQTAWRAPTSSSSPSAAPPASAPPTARSPARCGGRARASRSPASRRRARCGRSRSPTSRGRCRRGRPRARRSATRRRARSSTPPPPRRCCGRSAGAIRFDAPAAGNRPGRHGIWQRPVERRRFAEATLLLPWSEGALAEAPSPRGRRARRAGPGRAASGPAASARDLAAITYGANPHKKGTDRVLAAWRAARRPGETLVVAGLAGRDEDGSASPGMIAPAEYRALLRRARAFVTAPRREDFGIAQLEALADGAQLVTDRRARPLRRAPARPRARPAARRRRPRRGDPHRARRPGAGLRRARGAPPSRRGRPRRSTRSSPSGCSPPSSTGRCRLSRAWRGSPDSERSEDGAEERGRGGGDEHADDHRHAAPEGDAGDRERPRCPRRRRARSPSASTWVTISAANSAGASSAMIAVEARGQLAAAERDRAGGLDHRGDHRRAEHEQERRARAHGREQPEEGGGATRRGPARPAARPGSARARSARRRRPTPRARAAAQLADQQREEERREDRVEAERLRDRRARARRARPRSCRVTQPHVLGRGGAEQQVAVEAALAVLGDRRARRRPPSAPGRRA